MDGTARLLAVGGLVAGIAGTALGLSARGAAETVQAAPKEQVRTPAAAVRAPAGESGALEARVAALEAAGRREAPPEREEADPEAAAAAPPGGPDPALVSAYAALRKRVFSGTATADEQARFFGILKSPGFIDGLLADLEAKVERDPGDLEGRMTLADAYVSKLFTVPAGPEMGVWGTKAEDQWTEVLRQDERHWESRFNLAFSWSQYPEFLNKAPDSIREFETLRAQQEQGAPGDRHGSTYFHLHSLYRRMGNAAKAAEALEEGLRRFPEDADLRKVKDSGR